MKAIDAYTHRDKPVVKVDTQPGHYYVSIRDQVSNDPNDSRNKTILALGPFTTHTRAIELVDTVRTFATAVDGHAQWYQFGTCRIDPANIKKDDKIPIGQFTREIDVNPDLPDWEKLCQSPPIKKTNWSANSASSESTTPRKRASSSTRKSTARSTGSRRKTSTHAS